MAMIVGRPKHDVPIKAGDIYLLPAQTPHSPQQPAGTAGMAIERRRPEGQRGDVAYRSRSTSSPVRDRSTLTMWARPTGRKSTQGRQAAITAGRSCRASAATRLTSTRCMSTITTGVPPAPVEQLQAGDPSAQPQPLAPSGFTGHLPPGDGRFRFPRRGC